MDAIRPAPTNGTMTRMPVAQVYLLMGTEIGPLSEGTGVAVTFRYRGLGMSPLAGASLPGVELESREWMAAAEGLVEFRQVERLTAEASALRWRLTRLEDAVRDYLDAGSNDAQLERRDALIKALKEGR